MTAEKFYRLLLDLSILILGAWVLILAAGCTTLTTREADGPDTPQKFDAEGNPNFGPKPTFENASAERAAFHRAVAMPPLLPLRRNHPSPPPPPSGSF